MVSIEIERGGVRSARAVSIEPLVLELENGAPVPLGRVRRAWTADETLARALNAQVVRVRDAMDRAALALVRRAATRLAGDTRVRLRAIVEHESALALTEREMRAAAAELAALVASEPAAGAAVLALAWLLNVRPRMQSGWLGLAPVRRGFCDALERAGYL